MGILILLFVALLFLGYPLSEIVADKLHVRRDERRNFVISGTIDRKTAEQIARMAGKQARRDIGRL